MTPRAAYVLLQLTVLVWGFTAVIGKQITVDALTLVFYRQVLTVLALAMWMIARRRSFRVQPGQALQLVGIGAIISVHWLCFYGCIKAAGVAVAVLCLASVVLVTSIVEPLVFRRRMRLQEVLLGVGVLGGVSLLVRIETTASLAAIAAGIGAAVAGATFGTLNARVRRSISSDRMAVWQLASGALWLAIASPWVPGELLAPSAISGSDWVWLAVLAVGCTALPWIWSLEILTTLTPYTVALSVTLEPVYSMALAYFWFPNTERLTPAFYAGTAVLIALVMLDARLRVRAPTPA